MSGRVMKAMGTITWRRPRNGRGAVPGSDNNGTQADPLPSLLSPQPGSFTKVRKKPSTCRIASVNRSRLTGLVMYALACNW